MSKFLLSAVMVALLAPSVALAEEYRPPPCYIDPDVTCANYPGDPVKTPSYESGQAPIDSAERNYAAKGQDQWGNPLPPAATNPVPYRPKAEESAPPVVATPTPTPAPEPFGPVNEYDQDQFIELLRSMLYVTL